MSASVRSKRVGSRARLIFSVMAVTVFSALLMVGCGKDDDSHTHDWQWVVTTPATADEDGLETETCSICGETRGTRVIPKTGGDPDPNFVGIEGLTMDNYPRIDGATSTNPLNVIIAAKLLGLKYEWRREGSVKDVYLNTWELPSSFSGRIKSSQTHQAMINLIDSQTDLIILASKISAEEKQYADAAGVTLIETPIALDALDFILNAENTVNSLTVEQIQNIYLGNITNWSEVGGADEEIIPYIRNTNSGSQGMMNELVMNDTGMLDWDVSYADGLRGITMIQIYQELTDNPYGICYTPHYYKDYMVYLEGFVADIKTLAVDGIKPDSSSIKNKSYPFVAEVYVYIRAGLGDDTMAYKIYEWLQTEEGKSVIRESGYVPN